MHFLFRLSAILVVALFLGCATQTKTQSVTTIDTSEYLKTPEGQEEITVTGRLYEMRKGERVPPSPGSVSISYADDKGKVNSIFTIKKIDGKIEVTITGQTKISASGTFESKFKRGEIPSFKSRRIIGVSYCPENAMPERCSNITSEKGKALVGIDITNINTVNLGDIELK